MCLRTRLEWLLSLVFALVAGNSLASEVESMSTMAAESVDFPRFVARFGILYEDEIPNSFTRFRAVSVVNHADTCEWLSANDETMYVSSELAEHCQPSRLFVGVWRWEPGGESATYDLGEGYGWQFESSELVGTSLEESASFAARFSKRKAPHTFDREMVCFTLSMRVTVRDEEFSATVEPCS